MTARTRVPVTSAARGCGDLRAHRDPILWRHHGRFQSVRAAAGAPVWLPGGVHFAAAGLAARRRQTRGPKGRGAPPPLRVARSAAGGEPVPPPTAADPPPSAHLPALS